MRAGALGLAFICAALLPSVPLRAEQGPAGGSEFDLTRQTGEIALANWPDCNFFVIATEAGFSLVTWQSGYWAWDEGDRVYGATHLAGTHTILVVGWVLSGDMTVEFEAVGSDLRQAQKAYYRRCHRETAR